MSYRIKDVVQHYSLDYTGYVYPVLGETYSIKEQLKEKGAFYARGLGWFFNDELEARAAGLPYGKILVNHIVRKDAYGSYQFIYEDEIKAMVAAFQSDKVIEEENFGLNSDFVGEIGERIEVSGIARRVYRLNGRYGPYLLVIFEDSSGNVFTFTFPSKPNAPIQGLQYNIRAVIKDHVLYEDKKQTSLGEVACSMAD